MVQSDGADAHSSPPAGTDPAAILTKTEFASALAGLTRRQVRGLADKSGVPRSTISGWTTGQNLPNPNQIDQLRRLLTAVGVDAADQDAWAEAVLRVRQAPTQRGADFTRQAPYLGLEPFAETDTDRFFGREDAVAAVLEQVRTVRTDPTVGHRFVFLIGASGEGKSSVLRAGVAVALAAVDGTSVSWVAPASDGPSTVAGLGRDDVVLVDQFEQVFMAGRADLLDALVGSSAAQNGPTVVAAVRSDFYPRLVEVTALNDSLVSRLVVLSPMTQEGMRRAIVEPARRAGVDLEPGLVEMMLADVAPATSLDERPAAGVLPLLSHALLETWARGSGRQLRVADYVSLGGLNGAIEKTAEVAFGRLDLAGADAAGDLFRRLVNIDDDGLITRRHAGLDEIAEADGGDGVLTSVMWHFVAARLLTVDDSTVTLSHEVLLRAWSRLRAWVTEDRDGIRLHRELTTTATSWIEAGDDEGGLLAGGRLERARAWLDSPVGSRLAGPNERRLIEASEERSRRRAAQARSRFRRVTALAGVATVLAVIAGGATIVARNKGRAAETARIEAEVRDLANRSHAATDPYIAAFYAIEATQWTDEPLTVARTAWLDATQRVGRQSLLRSGFDLELSTADLAFSPDGSLLAALGRDGAVHLIDPVTREDVRISEPTESGLALAWSPDGDRIVTSGFDGVVRVFDAETLATTEQSTDVAITSANDVAWSPDGSTIAVTNNEGSLWLLDAGTLAPLGAAIGTGTGAAQRAAWHPEGTLVATSNFLGEMTFIDPTSQQPVDEVTLAGGVVANGLAWNPAGTTIAVTSSDGMVRYFDSASVTQLGPPTSTGSSYALNVVWSPDGDRLASVNQDGTLRVFTAVDHRPTGDPALTGTGGANAVAWSPDGTLIVTANEGGNVRFFTVPEQSGASSVYGARIAFSPDSTTMVTTNFDDTIRTYDVATFDPLDTAPGGGTDLTAIAWSPDGAHLAVGSATGAVSLRDAATPGSSKVDGDGEGAPVTWIGWTDDASAVIVADADGHVTRRSATDLSVVGEHQLAGGVVSGASDPGSKVVALAGADGLVRLVSMGGLEERGDPIRAGSTEANGVGWSTDGNRIATVDTDGTIQVVDPSDGSVDATYTAPVAAQRAAWNPTDDVIAVGMSDGSVWFFTRTMEKIGVLNPSDASVAALFWTPDGETLVSSHANGFTVRNRAWAVSRACDALGPVVPPEEMDRLIDIPDSTSYCSSGDVRDFTPLPATGGRTP